MANVQKYQSSAVGHMMAHYKREGDVPYQRQNIDPERTRLNYALGRGSGSV